ncbi:MAG: DUF1992 domain-containing protein [Candidatus Rokuibacteriota bacterium]|nr:MAG: DUF1992 domain-containing protein [Candidatus Rokubacteria bacterium]
MTERKPPGKSWESWFDEIIQRAQDEGVFQDLPGAGKPLPDLDKPYDPDWWAKQLVRREKISLLPPALELLRQVEAELAIIWTLSSEAEVRRRAAALNAVIATVNARAAEGPPTRVAPLDVDALVADWRRRSTANRKDG